MEAKVALDMVNCVDLKNPALAKKARTYGTTEVTEKYSSCSKKKIKAKRLAG
jgi:hypothetical protein